MLNFTDFEQIFSMSDESDPLMMLVWIIPIIIFVFYGQRIQLIISSNENEIPAPTLKTSYLQS